MECEDETKGGQTRPRWPVVLAAIACLILISPPLRPLLIVREIWASGVIAHAGIHEQAVPREARPAQHATARADVVPAAVRGEDRHLGATPQPVQIRSRNGAAKPTGEEPYKR